MDIDLITNRIYFALNLKKIVRIELIMERFNSNKKIQSNEIPLKKHFVGTCKSRKMLPLILLSYICFGGNHSKL